MYKIIKKIRVYSQMVLSIRLPSKLTAYRYRYQSASVKEIRALDELYLALDVVMTARHRQLRVSGRWSTTITKLLHEIYTQILLLQFVFLPPRVGQRKHVARTIDSFSPSDCWMKFRTRKEDLYRILIALRLNADGDIEANNRSKFTGEEILLIGLHRYNVTGPLETTMSKEFDLDFSQLSRAFQLFNNYVLDNFSYLVTNNLDYWVHWFPEFAEKIRSKLLEVGDIDYAQGSSVNYCCCSEFIVSYYLSLVFCLIL